MYFNMVRVLANLLCRIQGGNESSCP